VICRNFIRLFTPSSHLRLFRQPGRGGVHDYAGPFEDAGGGAYARDGEEDTKLNKTNRYFFVTSGRGG